MILGITDNTARGVCSPNDNVRVEFFQPAERFSKQDPENTNWIYSHRRDLLRDAVDSASVHPQVKKSESDEDFDASLPFLQDINAVFKYLHMGGAKPHGLRPRDAVPGGLLTMVRSLRK